MKKIILEIFRYMNRYNRTIINVNNDNEFKDVLNKLKIRLNFKNIEFINNLKNSFENNRISFTEFRNKISKLLNKEKTKRYTIEWYNNRGFINKEDIRSEILIRYRNKDQMVFFDHKEILEYFLKKNPFNFNLENIKYINNFVNSIPFKNWYLNKSDIYSFFKKEQNKLFKKRFGDKKDKGYIRKTKEYWLFRGYSEEEAKEKINYITVIHSKRCKEYWIHKGYTEEEAKEKVSIYQKEQSEYSKGNKQYWINLGYTEEEANKNSNEYSKQRSVWWYKHWINLGYTEEEAKEKVLTYNPASIKFKNYKNNIQLYIDYKNKIGNKNKEHWRDNTSLYITKVKEGKLVSSSQIENKCFSFLINYVNKHIIHKPYVVIFPKDFKSKNKNLYFYACDGYLKYKSNIIIFEYDSNIFHQKEKDDIRDQEILMIDNKILGIIRISESFFNRSNINLNIENKVKIINEAIKKIKNTQETVIRI